ncbi:hypothetical protein GP486_002922 [Trichoglossum hirsutum]|uniref:Vacuolar import and degradation protein 21 n=1 Tax=Trichoglossum hirsutum TaxID=265104 RepID=A0A9P8LE60_9PEZI|nr:hypothetical protein GP486_002922 [Trichoglossum hirsutum]
MTLDVLSEGILRSKREEIAGVVQSRKRKLREVYAVARYVEYGETVNPQFDIAAEPLDQLEITFLDANDLFKGRFFDETTLPKNGQRIWRYNTAPTALQLSGELQTPVTPKSELHPKQNEVSVSSQTSLLGSPGYAPALTKRAGTPKRTRRSSRSPVANGAATPSKQTTTPGTSRGSEADLSDVAAGPLDIVVDGVAPTAQTGLSHLLNGVALLETSGKDLVRPGSPSSPGHVELDIADASPTPPEDISENVSASERTGQDGQATELPPVDPQMAHVQEVNRQTVISARQDRKGDESRKRPPSLVVESSLLVAPNGRTKDKDVATPVAISSVDTLPTPTSSSVKTSGLPNATQLVPSMTGDLPASPSSTIGDSKASNTPGLNITSADTSPENDFVPSNAEALQSKSHSREYGETSSIALAYSTEEQVEVTKHDGFLSEAGLSGPHQAGSTDANAQLRLEEQQAAKVISDPGPSITSTLVPGEGETTGRIDKSHLAKVITEHVPDAVDEEEDEVVGVPTPEDGTVPEHGGSNSIPEKEDTIGRKDVDMRSQGQKSVAVLDGVGTAISGGRDAGEMDLNEKESYPGQPIRSPPVQRDVAQVTTADPSVFREREPVSKSPGRTNLDGNNEVVLSPKRIPTPPGRTPGDVQMEDTAVVDRRVRTDSPARTAPAVISAHSPPERMTTRVSSGAIKHKSVSEILGEVSKPNISPQPERTVAEKGFVESTRAILATETSTQASGSNTPQPPSTRPRTERKDKERSKLSAVTFAKRQPSKVLENMSLSRRDPYSASKQVATQTTEDVNYLQVYHVAQTASQPLDGLLAAAHKTITTANQYVNFHEMQDARLLRRIYSLQLKNCWSFRQVERSIEPERPLTHWDGLLDEMKWMRTDFREERKWKIVAAKKMADACKEWMTAHPDERAKLRVRTKRMNRSLAPPKTEYRFQDVDMRDGFISPVDLDSTEASHPTPDLVASAEDESISDAFDDVDVCNAVAPAEIFSLTPDDIVIGIRKTPSSEKLLHELPLYEPLGQHASDLPPDAEWKTPILPVSKYVLGKMVVKNNSPPRKRSRYEFEEDNDQALEHKTVDIDPSYGFYRTPKRARFERSPERNDVALFNPENKPIRDRIHAGHLFRPPSEHPMPPQGFFECRGVAQWTFAEEEELKSLVKEYCYNWSLISSIVSSRSAFSSSAERRTPWECFERWISLEGLPLDMQKTQYFRALHSRLDAAKHPSQFLPGHHQGPNNASLTPLRRRDTRSVRVERRKNSRHLSLIDAIRKVAKKRETTIQKLQHAAGLAAMRKANEVQQPRTTVSTPQDFSRIKHEREVKLQERHEQYRQQVLAQQRVRPSAYDVFFQSTNLFRLAQQQRLNAQHQAVQQHSSSGGVPAQQRNATPVTGNSASPLVAPSFPNGQSQASIPNQGRQFAPLHGLPNGIASIPASHNSALPQVINGGVPMSTKGVPQAPMQGNIVTQPRINAQMPPDPMRVVIEKNRIQEHQRRVLQHQQQQQQQHLLQSQQQGRSSSPSNMSNMNGSAAQAVMHNSPNMMAAFQAATSNGNGIPGPATNGMNATAGSSASPRMGQSLLAQTTQSQSLPNGMAPAMSNISHINQQLKATYPQMSAEQIQRFTSEQIAREYRMTQAMNAAAGGNNPHVQQQAVNMMNGTSIPQSQQQMYAQMMRAQQATQIGGIAGPGTVNGANRPPSRSVTPQTQRTGSTQGHVQVQGQGQNQSPRMPQAQAATGQ